MTASGSRSPWRQLRYSRDNGMTHQPLSKLCRYRCCCMIIRLRPDDCQIPQVRWGVFRISSMEVIGCVLPSRLIHFLKLHLDQFVPQHALPHHLGDNAHHPARFVIIAQLALLCRSIILMRPVRPIVGTCKITRTVSASSQCLPECLFGLSAHQSGVFSLPDLPLLLLNRPFCVFSSLSCPSGCSPNIFLSPFFLIFIAQ